MADPVAEAEAALVDAQKRLAAARQALMVAQAAVVYRRGYLDAVRSLTKKQDVE